MSDFKTGELVVIARVLHPDDQDLVGGFGIVLGPIEHKATYHPAFDADLPAEDLHPVYLFSGRYKAWFAPYQLERPNFFGEEDEGYILSAVFDADDLVLADEDDW